MAEANEDFEEDFELMTGNKNNDAKKSSKVRETLDSNSDVESLSEEEEDVYDEYDSDVENSELIGKKRKHDGNVIDTSKSKKLKTQTHDESDDNFSDLVSDEELSEDENSVEQSESDDNEEEKEHKWEDIYGRLRDKDGAVVQVNYLITYSLIQYEVFVLLGNK